MEALKNIAQTLWVGGMWAIGFIAAPVLFRAFSSGQAGSAAGVMFAWMAWVGMVCGVFLLFHAIYNHGFRVVKTAPFWLVLGMLVCTFANHFAVFPIISELKSQASVAAKGVLGGGFSTWHAISSLIYGVQCLLGLFLVIKDSNRGR